MRLNLLRIAVALAAIQSPALAQTRNTPRDQLPVRGPDLSKLNQSATRVLDRAGTTPLSPFIFDPFFQYPPVLYYPPIYDGPVMMFDPYFVPPIVPPFAPKAPAKPDREPVPPPKAQAPAKDELDQRAEMQKHLRAGNDAFANAEYATALKRYEQAVAAAPVEPIAYFHQAQAQLALGKHAQAVVSIQRGLRLHPRWAESAFQPRALYRDRQGDFDQHLAELADLIAKNLNDDSLMFLLGYQLWFDGKRDEATALFQRAASLTFDTTFVDRFLKAQKVAGP